MKNTLIPSIILYVFIFLTSCMPWDDDYDPHLPDVYISKEQKEMVPYKPGDSLLFTNKNGDTIIYYTSSFINEMIKNTYYVEYNCSNE